MTDSLDHPMKAIRAKAKVLEDAKKAPPRPDGDDPFINDDMAAGSDPKLVPATITKAGDLAMEKIDWIWQGWLGRGMLHLIAGVPEAGKTTCALSVAATLSSGERWPDDTRAKPGNVLLWTGEDSPVQTILPRLAQMGADVNRVWIVTGQRDGNGKMRQFNPGADLPNLALAAKAMPGGCDMLIIDPIVAVIGAKLDNSNNAGHREKLQPLVDFATELNCAVLGVTHFTKGTIGKDPCDRVTGSLAFGAVARIIMVATKNKHGDPERMFLMAKNNLTDTSGGFGYSIVGSPPIREPGHHRLADRLG
jgi:putative DNA primase/helicase